MKECKKCYNVKAFHFAKDKEIGFYSNKKKPEGQFCIIIDGTYEGEETGERFEIDIDFCPWCGKKLDKENYCF